MAACLIIVLKLPKTYSIPQKWKRWTVGETFNYCINGGVEVKTINVIGFYLQNSYILYNLLYLCTYNIVLIF